MADAAVGAGLPGPTSCTRGPRVTALRHLAAGGRGQPPPDQPRRGRRRRRVVSEHRWARHRAPSSAAPPRRALGGVGQRPRGGRGPLRVRGHRPQGGAHRRARARGVLPRVLQRHALAALPRRGAPAQLRAALVAGLRRGEPPLRRGRGGRSRARCDGLDPRLPVPAGPQDAPRAQGRRAHRLLPPHPLPSPGALHAAAVVSRNPPRGCSRRPRRLPGAGGGVELLPARSPAARGEGHQLGRRAPGSLHPHRRLPDLRRRRRAQPQGAAACGAPARPRRSAASSEAPR